MRRMALLFAVFSSSLCIAQQQDVPVVPQAPAAATAVAPVKPVQATSHAAEATPPAPKKSVQAPCKPKPEKSARKAKFPTSSGHEPI